jgi:hypothetical protein
MTFLQAEAPLRLKFDGFAKPLRLRPLRREGSLEIFTVQGGMLRAVRFVPAGAVREVRGRLTPISEAADSYAVAVDAFEALGRRLQAVAPRAALGVEAVSRTASGCFWLQSPQGLTLETWLADQPGPVAEPVVATFARRLAEALEELHAVGIVHGDLSPRAVLIEGGEVRLTGFMVDRRPFFRALRGQQDLVEPGYAPPEAHDGAVRHPIGPAADLYAASALLQRLLTGRAPSAANLAARMAGDNAWAIGVAASAALRAGIEAGLAPSVIARPASAADGLAGLELGSEPEEAPWFEGAEKTLAVTAPPEPEADALVVPPLPATEPNREPQREPEFAPDFGPSFRADEAPLTLPRETPSQRRFGWWIGAASLVAVITAVALAAPRFGPRPEAPPRAQEPEATAPSAPAGCQWLSATGGWRLRCTDAPAQGLRLPERFDAQTATRAAAGEPSAMERLGAFYRLRAGETTNANRGAYAYQALGWLQRAVATAEDGRPDTARARDDAALALGQMLAHGEGGRAPDPTAAEARLRQAAAGSRADAVLALGQLLESQAGGDADRLAEARGLYARVAQLGDASALQREGERGLARIDAIPKPPPIVAEAPSKPVAEKPVEPRVEETRAPTPKAVASKAKPPPAKTGDGTSAKPSTAKAQPAKRASPVVAAPPKKSRVETVAKPPTAKAVAAKRVPPPVTPAPRAVAAPTRAPTPAPQPRPVLRTWTASAFVKVDPTADFSASVEATGRAACASDSGETLSVRSGDTFCPNGVNYCQVRAVATCQGARP